jgi:hypothetical protein
MYLAEAEATEGVGMKKYAVILVVVLTAVMFFAGCGSSGSSVVGVYKSKYGDGTAVLTLKAGNKGTFSLAEDLAGISVNYKVKDGSVVLTGPDGKEIANSTFKIEAAGLRDFAGNLYKKQ